MNENELLADMRTLSACLSQLADLTGSDILLSGRERYHELLENAYAAYGRVETQVDEWGQQLEYEHQRLDKEVKQSGPNVAEPDVSPGMVRGKQRDRRLSVIGGLK